MSAPTWGEALESWSDTLAEKMRKAQSTLREQLAKAEADLADCRVRETEVVLGEHGKDPKYVRWLRTKTGAAEAEVQRLQQEIATASPEVPK